MLVPLTPRILFTSIAGVLILLACLRTLYQHPTIQAKFTRSKLEKLEPEQSAVMNSTLGFQHVFVLNLPHRADRRENIMQQMEGGPNLTLSWRNGVYTGDMKPPPSKWNTEEHSPGLLASFQAHQNILEEMVRDDIETAVIFEDDIQWDNSRLQDHLVKMSSALSLMEFTDIRPSRPYGSEWDVLWLGTCINPAASDSAVVFRMPSTGQVTYVWDVDTGVYCTYAYAVTKESARRIIHHMKALNQGYDIELGDAFCRYNKCPLIWPSLFSGNSLGSDIETYRNGTQEAGDETTEAEGDEAGEEKKKVDELV